MATKTKRRMGGGLKQGSAANQRTAHGPGPAAMRVKARVAGATMTVAAKTKPGGMKTYREE